MDENKLAELKAATAAAKKAVEDAGGDDETLNKALADAEAAEAAAIASSQDPIDNELQRQQQRTERTEAEKAAFTLKKNIERARALGVDVNDIIGTGSSDTAGTEEDDKRPMTVGEYKRIQQDTAKKTALQLADAIEDAKERDLVKNYLNNRIVPSGDPQEDLRFARQAVNALKTTQMLEEAARRGETRTHGSGPGGSNNGTGSDTFVPTAEEAGMMKPPFNLTKEQVIASRPKE